MKASSGSGEWPRVSVRVSDMRGGRCPNHPALANGLRAALLRTGDQQHDAASQRRDSEDWWKRDRVFALYGSVHFQRPEFDYALSLVSRVGDALIGEGNHADHDQNDSDDT